MSTDAEKMLRELLQITKMVGGNDIIDKLITTTSNQSYVIDTLISTKTLTLRQFMKNRTDIGVLRQCAALVKTKTDFNAIRSKCQTVSNTKDCWDILTSIKVSSLSDSVLEPLEQFALKVFGEYPLSNPEITKTAQYKSFWSDLFYKRADTIERYNKYADSTKALLAKKTSSYVSGSCLLKLKDIEIIKVFLQNNLRFRVASPEKILTPNNMSQLLSLVKILDTSCHKYRYSEFFQMIANMCRRYLNDYDRMGHLSDEQRGIIENILIDLYPFYPKACKSLAATFPEKLPALTVALKL